MDGLIALHGKVIVTVDPPPETYKDSRLVIPEQDRGVANTATVLASADSFIPVGSRIAIGKYAGTAFRVGDHEYVALLGTDVLAIIEPSPSLTAGTVSLATASVS